MHDGVRLGDWRALLILRLSIERAESQPRGENND
jgi:hypothetical protein